MSETDRSLQGRTVIGPNATPGTIIDMVTIDERQHGLIAWNDGRRLLVPLDLLVAQTDHTLRLPLHPDEFAKMTTAVVPEEERLIIPIIREDLVVEKRRIDGDRVRIQTWFEAHDEQVDVALQRTDVDVQHVARNEPVATMPEVRTEGDTLIIPIVDEVLVVEKRLILREEVHVTRRTTTVQESHQATVRQGQVHIERHAPDATDIPHSSSLEEEAE